MCAPGSAGGPPQDADSGEADALPAVEAAPINRPGDPKGFRCVGSLTGEPEENYVLHRGIILGITLQGSESVDQDLGSVADPDPGSGAFLTSGYGMGKK